MTAQPRKLYKLPKQGMISGVAAGFADYFDMDVTIMRLIFIAAAVITGGAFIIAYLILIVAMPTPDSSQPVNHQSDPDVAKRQDNLAHYIGIGIIGLGIWLLVNVLWPDWLQVQWQYIWPLALITVGVLIIARSRR